MDTFGDYVVEGTVRRGAMSALIRVRRADASGDGRLALKRLSPPPGTGGDTADRFAAAELLESAWIQADAAAACPQAWAPVHDLGQHDGRPYVLTDRFDANLDDLALSPRGIGAATLQRVVTTIVDGLAGFEQAMGRPHGNLKPGNVLVDLDEDRSPTRVCLCDPAPASSLCRRDAARRDRRALGAMIVALVTGEPAGVSDAWPVPADAAWARLGPVGEGWRTLAGDLLNPTLNAADLAWDEVARRAGLLTPPAVRKRRWPYAAAAAVVLLAAGLCGYLFYPREYTPPATLAELHELATHYRDWAGTLQSKAGSEPGLNADLKRVLDGGILTEQGRIPSPDQLLGINDNRFYLKLAAADPTDATSAQIIRANELLAANQKGAVQANKVLSVVRDTKNQLEAYIQRSSADPADGAAPDGPARAILDAYAQLAVDAFSDEQVHVLEAIRWLDAARDQLTAINTSLRSDSWPGEVTEDAIVAARLEDLNTQLGDLAAGLDTMGDDADARDRKDLARRLLESDLTTLRADAEQFAQAIAILSDPQRMHYASFLAQHREDIYLPFAQAGGDLSEVGGYYTRWLAAALDKEGGARVPATPDPRTDWRVTLAAGEELALDACVGKLEADIARLRDQYLDEISATARGGELQKARSRITVVSRPDLFWTNRNREEVVEAVGLVNEAIRELDRQVGADLTNAMRDRGEEIDRLNRIVLAQGADAVPEADRYFTELNGRNFSGSAAIQDAWEDYRARVIDRTRAAVDLERGIKSVLWALMKIDQALPKDLLDPDVQTPDGWDSASTRARYRALRDTRIREVTADGLAPVSSATTSTAGEVTPPVYQYKLDEDALADAAQRLTRWRQSAHQALQAYAQIESQLDAFHHASETGSGLNDTYAVAQEALRVAEIADDLRAVDARYKLINALYGSQMSDARSLLGLDDTPDLRSALIVLAESGGADGEHVEDGPLRFAAGFAAWSAYQDAPPDQQTAAHLGEHLRLRETLTELVGLIEEEDRRGPFIDRFNRDASSAWQATLNRAATPDEIDQTLAQLTGAFVEFENAPGKLLALDPESPELGGVDNTLNPRGKVNLILYLYRARTAALRDDADEQGAKAVAQALSRQLEPYVEVDPGVKTLYANLVGAIEEAEAGQDPAGDQPLGPIAEWVEQAGISVREVPDDEPETEDATRTYAFNLDKVQKVYTVRFRLVDPSRPGLEDASSAQRAYVSVSEVPIGFLVDVLEQSGRNAEFSGLAYNGQEAVFDSGRHRVWDVDRDGMVILHQGNDRLRDAPWLRGWVIPDVVLPLFQGVVAPITPLQPVQQFNPLGAYYFCRLVGCRLPTALEWQAAVASVGGLDRAREGANLRDPAWQRQHDLVVRAVQQVVGEFRDKPWPDTGTFTSLIDKDKTGDTAAPGRGPDDGSVWPREVDPEAPDFEDLIGNVAEWVMQQTGETDQGVWTPAEGIPTGDEVKEVIGAMWKVHQVGVIGGSALSNPDAVEPDAFVVLSKSPPAVWPPARVNDHFADVGFRLAFTAGRQKLSITLKGLLKQTTHILP